MKTAICFLRSIACFLGMSCLPLSASPLLGSWYADDATGSAVVTFFPNNEFVFIQDGDPTVDPTGQDGIERGTFVWNPTTGAFTTQVTLDTNKAWGFSHGIAGVSGVTASVVAETLTVTIPGEGDFSLARVLDSNPLVGAWWTLDAAGSDEGTVVTFLTDGRFFLARDGDPASDPGGNDGMEAGTWSWSELTGALTTTVQTDTNGTWGLSHADAVKTIAMHPRAQRLIYTNSTDPSPSTFYRIRPISFSGWVSEQGLTGNSALQLSKPFANGFENILLYAMNLDGTSTPDQHPQARTLSSPSGRQLQMDYRLRGGLHGVSLIPHYSNDLVTWTEVPESMVQEIGMADPETSLLRATIPVGTGKSFARLKAIEMSITSPPVPTTISSGGTATLTVAVAGSTPTSYQWYQGAVGVTTNPVGTNSASFTTPALTSTTSYWVRITSAAGSINSASTTVTVTVPPTIKTQPASMTITSGSTAILTVTATGAAPLTYQWYQGSLGATTSPVGTNSSSFTTPALTATTSYWVRVTNSAGSVNSSLATVTTTTPPAAPTGFALIPGGSFMMGQTSGDSDIADAPLVSVNVSAFYIEKTEVTKELWDQVRTWAVANGYTDLAVGAGKGANHPVHSVSWFDMLKWCNARSQKESLSPCYTVSGLVMKAGTTAPTVSWSANGYRLPTEAEWEKAARGGASGKRFPWGMESISHSQANYISNTNYSYDVSPTRSYHPTYAIGSAPYTSAAGSFAANGYGLNDIAGNVWEACWDSYSSSTYVDGATDPRGPSSGSWPVFRGGSWSNYAGRARCAYREYGYSRTYVGNEVGFRVVLSSVL